MSTNAGMRIKAGAAAAVVRLLGVTWRLRLLGDERLARAREQHPNVVFCFWHGRLLPLCWSHRNWGIEVLTSEHRDGELIGQTIRRLGFGHVRGSSTRGGARALRELVRKVRAGRDLGITVDGPRGPRHVVKPGALEIARLTGAAIVPVTTGSSRQKVFSSWDGFQLPAPFARVRVIYGEPIVVPREMDDEEMEARRLEVERALTTLTEENDGVVSQ